MLKMLIKSLLVRSNYLPLMRRALPYHDYNFTPAQLLLLCQFLEKIRNLPGPIVEVGCAEGCTTVFLNKFMDCMGIEKEYICLDTFSGFTDEDVNYEINRRGKGQYRYTGFRGNDHRWFEKTMEINGISRVQALAADVNKFDFTQFKEVSFALIDVDLYVPVMTSLRGLYSRMADGGIIVVDDCLPDNNFDGALEAYQEFVASHSLREQIVLEKLGLVCR